MKPRERRVAVLFCFWTVMAIGNSFAQDNAALLSASITNGTPVAPRSVFTQTWTFQNTGTTTWTPGPNGYTLDMVGLDSLGAIPLDTNSSGTYHFPRAAINSGKSIAPGGTASFSMDFIAPEVSGSYTDSFQLNGTNWFGPKVTAQVAVESGGNTNVFDRSRTISYANNYAAYVCSDGGFWTNGSAYEIYPAGAYVFSAVPTGPGVDGGIGDDCAHFVSCCIGSESHLRGGGMNIPSRGGTYGEPGAARLVTACLLNPRYAVEVSSLNQLEPGDVIGWNWGGDPSVSNLDHVTLYEGNNLMASHAISAEDVGPKYFQSTSSTWVWHLIHILDYPTLWTTHSGTSTTFTWTTNWNKYALYSAPNITGPWTKISTKPTVTGVTNKLTLTMPGTGSIYYRLEMP